MKWSPTGATRDRLLLCTLGCLIFLTNLGVPRLWDLDEAIFSQAAVEMWQRGDWITPWYNGQLFAHKPPVMYWVQIAAYEVFGPTEFAARLGSALFGLATLLVTYELGRSLYSARAGLWAGVMLASTLNFSLIARAATPDAYLTFFTTLALWALVRGTAPATHSQGGAWQPTLPPTWQAYALAYAAMAGAVLVKGPVGIVLPMAVWGLFLLIEQRRAESSGASLRSDTVASNDTPTGWLRQSSSAVVATVLATARLFWPPSFLATVWRMRPITALGVLLLIAAPWYLAVGLATDGAFLQEFFLVHNVGRAAQAMERHHGPFWYYPAAVCVGFFPWSVLFVPSTWLCIQAVRSQQHERAASVLLLCWIGVWLGAFTLVATKLPSYVIPAYPALALACGALIDHWLKAAERNAEACPKPWLHLATGVLGCVGAAMLVVLPLITAHYFSGEWTPGLPGLLLIAGALCAWRLTTLGRTQQAVQAMAAAAVTFCTALYGFAVLPIDAYQTSPLVAEFVKRDTAIANVRGGEGRVLAAFDHLPPSLIFYHGPVVGLDSQGAVTNFFRKSQSDACLFTTDEGHTKLAGALPPDVVVLARFRRLLRNDHVVVLGREQPQTQTDSPPARPPEVIAREPGAGGATLRR